MDYQFWLNAAYPQRNKSFFIPDNENLYIIAGEELMRWPLMNSVWPIMIITSAYLLFVLKIGPAYMKNRPPLRIKYFVSLYDLCQAIFNGYLVVTSVKMNDAAAYALSHSCHPMEPTINPYWFTFNYLGWCFMISKIGDLLDTVFFVLRKKESHVTFLHVYHHTTMALCAWFFLKYRLGEQGILFAWLNGLIHAVMYSYYFLSTLGPGIQKYLWWKKYLTTLQMLQFCIALLFACYLQLNGCNIPGVIYYFAVINGMVLLSLFWNFYRKTYDKKHK